jgi:hypothetical protein
MPDYKFKLGQTVFIKSGIPRKEYSRAAGARRRGKPIKRHSITSTEGGCRCLGPLGLFGGQTTFNRIKHRKLRLVDGGDRIINREPGLPFQILRALFGVSRHRFPPFLSQRATRNGVTAVL